jgi:hypothetical protein
MERKKLIGDERGGWDDTGEGAQPIPERVFPSFLGDVLCGDGGDGDGEEFVKRGWQWELVVTQTIERSKKEIRTTVKFGGLDKSFDWPNVL